MTRPIHEADDDSRRGYDLGLACIREQRIRAGEIPPTTEREMRWASEGPRPSSQLDTVQGGEHG